METFDAVDPGVPASADPGASTVAIVRHEFEEQFGRFGDPVGQYSSAAGRAKGHAFWRMFGAVGAGWLIQRLSRPVDIEQAWGTTNVLAMLGPLAIDPILTALKAHLPAETSDTLLSALAGMDPSRVAPWAGPIRDVVRSYLRHRDDAVRGKAVNATASLDPRTAITLLEAALPYEPDVNVRTAINDEIADRA